MSDQSTYADDTHRYGRPLADLLERIDRHELQEKDGDLVRMHLDGMLGVIESHQKEIARRNRRELEKTQQLLIDNDARTTDVPHMLVLDGGRQS